MLFWNCCNYYSIGYPVPVVWYLNGPNNYKFLNIYLSVFYYGFTTTIVPFIKSFIGAVELIGSKNLYVLYKLDIVVRCPSKKLRQLMSRKI